MPAPTFSAPASTDALVAMADQCVQCGLCLPHCPTYRLDASEAESPRGRIAYIKGVATGLIQTTDTGDQHLDHCLGCRRCESACPAGVPYENLLVQARHRQAKRNPTSFRQSWPLLLLARPALLQRLLRLYQRCFPILPNRLRLLPRPEQNSQRPAPIPASKQVALFTGCIARSYEAGAHVALEKLLAAAGIGLTMPTGQTCCGSAARHAGDLSQAAVLAGKNRRAFTGHRTILTLASGCHDTLAQSLGETQGVMDALAFLEPRADALSFKPADGKRIALHLPCSQRVDRGDGAMRKLLARVPGLNIVELTDTGCCGAGGLHMLSEPGRAAALRAPLLEALANCGATELLSANIGCRLHLGNGTTIPVRHPVEFLAEHLA